MHLFAQGYIELLDVPRLETELRLLERKPRRNGRGDDIDHPPRAHDDVANSVCGALLLAASQVTATSYRQEYADAVTRAVTDYSPLDLDSGPIRYMPRHPHLLPPNLQGLYQDDFSQADRDYDPLSRP